MGPLWLLYFPRDFPSVFNTNTYYYFGLPFIVKVKQMTVKFEIEKFNGSNFRLWKMKMKANLRKKSCLEAIGERPKNVEDKKWEQMDGDTITSLHLAVVDNILSNILELSKK